MLTTALGSYSLNLYRLVYQDISHVLASIFKDVYTKDIIRRDTLSNLVKSKRGQSSSHHERYVEELQQVPLALVFGFVVLFFSVLVSFFVRPVVIGPLRVQREYKTGR